MYIVCKYHVLYACVYIYIYREREREVGLRSLGCAGAASRRRPGWGAEACLG